MVSELTDIANSQTPANPRSIVIDYDKPGHGITRYVIDPVNVRQTAAGNWLLVAFKDATSMRTFRIDRIRAYYVD